MEVSLIAKHVIMVEGKRVSAHMVAKEYNVPYNTVVRRIKAGAKTLEEVLTSRIKTILVEINGEVLSLPKLATKYNIPWGTIYHRYERGLRGFELIRHDHYGGITPRDKGTRLTKEQAKAIFIKLKTDSYSQKDLAEMFGCSETIISNINTGKRWGLVTSKIKLEDYLPSGLTT